MLSVYPENFETKIGFDKIRDLLKSRCLSSLGKELVDEIEFYTNYEYLSETLALVQEFVTIIREMENFPTSYYFDLREALTKIKIEGRFLETEELFDLKRSLETISGIVRFLKQTKEDQLPCLKRLLSGVQVYPYVIERIDSILNKYGKIKDNASPELAHIRKELLSKQSNVSKRLQAILKKAQDDGLIEDDASVAMRDGRAVIPIASAHKRKLNGIVHDESATGKTSYVEPAEVVEMNNQIRELEYAEMREIVRILTAFSNDIRPYLPDLMQSYAFLGKIDFIRAKALYAIEIEAIKPYLDKECQLDWDNASHPLLMMALRRENRKVVPLNVRLTPQKHILLISGPNAGGKSVCLKTVGLLQYMLQCGLLIPVKQNTIAGVFDKIFIDIGDEQSIENDLSTYSSHLMNMKFFLKNSNERTLILIDEFGTGTEPMLGGAIAESILAQLNEMRVFGVITTHYTNLKHFASSTDGIENAAMMYDSSKMEPLFQLDIGKPGSSFAFEIARKIGLPENILQEATDKIGKDHINFDKHLRDIVRDKRYWETKRMKIRKVEKTLDELAEKYGTDLSSLEKQRKEIIQKARQEADQILSEANKRIENTIREIRETQADKEKTKQIRAKLVEFKQEIADNTAAEDDVINQKIQKLKEKESRRNQNRAEKKPQEQKEKAKEEEPDVWKAGDKVVMAGNQNIGEILELNEKNAVVAFGQIRTSVSRDKLQKITNNEAKKIQKTYNQTMPNINKGMSEKRLSFKTEIDVRGQRAEEALQLIQGWIDDAIMLDFSELRILHGKGNGILKEMIRSYLKSEPAVKTFHDEHVQFGGAGITVVEIG
ncbi:MAG TPA: Smr/MutS family protein [Prolixibacteraceae bacterium]|nr:Smr/MutS family protein [Prolixibacteraceae bacterium]